jgi:competence protein ComEA
MHVPNLPNLDARLLKFAAVTALAALTFGFVISWLGQPSEFESTASNGEFDETIISPEQIIIHVKGFVFNPGVYELLVGSRVIDALTAAGGLKPGKNSGDLNLARTLIDGEQINVGASAERASAGARSDGLININTATAAQLEELPGIGEVLAKRIIDYRTQNGFFSDISQLGNVSGIGSAKYADLKDKISVS